MNSTTRSLSRRRILSWSAGLGAALAVGACGTERGRRRDGSTGGEGDGGEGEGETGEGALEGRGEGAGEGAREGSAEGAREGAGEGAEEGAHEGQGEGEPLTCGEETDANIQGPFYLPGSPERSVIGAGLVGVGLSLHGRVLDRGCRPIGGAIVDIWQADAAGAYDEDGMTLRGHQRTDDAGRYALTSIVPGRYLNGPQYRPAHIHVRIAVADRLVLTTQLYFPGDRYNAVDSFFLPSLLVRDRLAPKGTRDCAFDFVVATSA